MELRNRFSSPAWACYFQQVSKGAILVIRGGAMGDFIVTLPVLAALRERFPETRLEVVAYPGPASLAAAAGVVAGFRSIESRGLASYFARKGELSADWAAYFAGFNLIFSYLYDPDEFFQGNVTSVTAAQFIQGPHRPDDSGREHVTDQLLVPLRRLAIFDADPEPRLTLTGALGQGQGQAGELELELALHPGSSAERKNWPEPRWAELIADLVRTTGWKFLLLGGEAEGGRLERLATLIPSERREVWRHRPLNELAARLSRASGFVGHDTGPSHLSAALGLPGVVLWGETNAAVWRPRSPRFEILHAGPGLASLPVQVVRAAILRMFPV